jgi:hypothetical protein
MQNDRLTMTFAIRHFYDVVMTLSIMGMSKKIKVVIAKENIYVIMRSLSKRSKYPA